jgi:hypothetical protein
MTDPSGFDCPYLGARVDLSADRERHIADRHPDLLPDHRHRLAEVLADPDQVRRSVRVSTARLFSRWFESLRGGKHVVVVVISEPEPDGRLTGLLPPIWRVVWLKEESNGNAVEVPL